MQRRTLSVSVAGLLLWPATSLLREPRLGSARFSSAGLAHEAPRMDDAGSALQLAPALVQVGVSDLSASSKGASSNDEALTSEASFTDGSFTAPQRTYAGMRSAVVDSGTTLAVYEHRHYSLLECKALCDRHPACRSFLFGWRSTRSCSLQDKCITANATLVSNDSTISTFRTFYRNCDGEASKQTAEFLARPVGGATAAATEEEPLFLFVGVVTAPGYFLRREYIRKSWMSSPDVGPGRAVEARFFVGEPKPEDVEALQKEIDRYDDIVQLPVADSYDNLTAKTLELLRWSVFYKEAKFVMKLDDDTYPNFRNLLPILRSSMAPYSLHGHIFTCAPVLNFTKWAERSEVYNQPFYPTYAQGSGYILSYELAKDIGVDRYQDHKATMLHNEDASVGFWIRRDELVDINMKGIVYNDLAPKSTLYGCREGDVLSMNLQVTQMPCMQRKEAQGQQNVCCPEAYKKDYNKEATDNVSYDQAESIVTQALQQPAVQRSGPEGIPVSMVQLSLDTSQQERLKYRCYNG